MWQCPKCKDADHLRVSVSVWADLIQPENDREAFETDIDGGDHEWDTQHAGMYCDMCGYSDNANKFDIGEAEENDDDEEDEEEEDDDDNE